MVCTLSHYAQWQQQQGHRGLMASLWYEQSHSTFQSLRKLEIYQSQACQFLIVGWGVP